MYRYTNPQRQKVGPESLGASGDGLLSEVRKYSELVVIVAYIVAMNILKTTEL